MSFFTKLLDLYNKYTSIVNMFIKSFLPTSETLVSGIKQYTGFNYVSDLRPRTKYTVLGTLVVFMIMFLASPETGIINDLPFGAEQLLMITIIAKSLLYATLLHVTRKAFLDYPEADFSALAKTALTTPTGAGLIAIALGLMTLAFSIVISVAAFA